jgi:hypothetical protein
VLKELKMSNTMSNTAAICCLGTGSWDQRIFKGMLGMLPTEIKWQLTQNKAAASVWFIDIDNVAGQQAWEEAKLNDDKVVILFTRNDLAQHATDFAINKPLRLKPLQEVLNQAGRAASYKSQLRYPTANTRAAHYNTFDFALTA